MKRDFKRILSLLLCAAMIFTVAGTAFAADEREVVETGFCGENGENLTWTLYDDGELVISGEGRMDWYDVMGMGTGCENKRPPWFKHYGTIDVITLEEGVTSIGNEAFYPGEKAAGFNPAVYYKINLPKSLELIEDQIFEIFAENRIIGKHLAYCYAGSKEEWQHVQMRNVVIEYSTDEKPVNRTITFGASFGLVPQGRYEGIYYNGEEPAAFCKLVQVNSAEVDIVTHYYASKPEAAKIEWYMVNQDREYKVGEIATNEHEPVEIVTPEFEEGDVYMKAKIVDADGKVIVSSENLWIGDASIKEPTFFEKVKMYFQIVYFEFQMMFYILNAAIDAGLIREIFKSWFGNLIWWD